MFCPSCGSQAGDGSSFCVSCGAPMASSPTPSQASPPPPQNAVGAGFAGVRSTIPRFRATGWFLIAGAVGVAIAGFLPWAQVSVEGVVVESVSKPAGGVVFLIVLAAAALAFGYPAVNTRSLVIWRRIGITVMVIVLSIFVITNWSDFNSIRNQFGSSDGIADVNAGSGLYLYTVAIVAIWISVIRIWLAKVDHSGGAPSQVAFNSGPGVTQPWVPVPSQAPATATQLNPPPAQPASGWYPDPQGVARLRYWDGAAWTEQTQA
jgi:Protein of unknown function (DUF2510)/zinc-ribbon domain